ncbi:MAG: Si-specific NAD(P)(+) transhydrogenase [Oligoflexales bacterium]|nr:Si-specific NAD(P)(+) transhydrogenase [Oligoflexales bacterium]
MKTKSTSKLENSADLDASSSLKHTYDLTVIGTGPAGLYAAVQGAKLGKKVAIVEKDPRRLGGAWIHTGTLPSKTLRESVASIASIRFHVGADWMLRVTNQLANGSIFQRAQRVSMTEEETIKRHIESNKIKFIQGQAYLEDRYTVRCIREDATCELIHTDKVFIATGSRPRRPSDIPFDGWRVIDSDEILSLQYIPKEMLIFGAGVVGCEYACIFSALGVKVTLVDARSKILQMLDQEIVRELQRSMETLGVKFILGQPLGQMAFDGPRVVAEIGQEKISSDLFVYTAGRVSNTDRLGLERIGVEVNERGAIKVNDCFQTAVHSIYAGGDAIGPPALAATSTEQGRLAIRHAFGLHDKKFPSFFPIGVYTIPELSCAGKNEEELIAEGIEYVVGKAFFSEVARGNIQGDNAGLLKLLVAPKSQKLLGIHIVGEGACNLIHIGMAFMLKGGHVQDLVNMIFNYPTLAESYRIAAFNALNKIFKDGNFQDPETEVLISSQNSKEFKRSA